MEEELTPMEEQKPDIEENTNEPKLDVSPVEVAAEKIRKELSKVIVGQTEMIDLILAALFVRGHVLVEGVPGIAKTLTIKLLAKALSVDFNRIQFTPDLMPADVTGTSIFNMKNADFEFKKGPIFSNLILIDEINRAPAKTQAALFEVMEETQVTFDGQTMPLDEPFMIIATQNPIEQEGTYKLPEAQQDRFIFKINIHYPNPDEETQILIRFQNDFNLEISNEVKKVLSKKDIEQSRKIIQEIYIKEDLLKYIASIVNETRNNKDLFLGASPRASLAIMKTSKAVAAMKGRDFVTPDDIKQVAYHVLNHRIILSPEKEIEGFDVKSVLEEIFSKIEIPR
jgi:MoxR-like ATPase